MNKQKNANQLQQLLRLGKLFIGAVLSATFLYYAWFIYSELPQFQTTPALSQVKQVNQTVVNQVTEKASEHVNRAPIPPTSSYDPFAHAN